jgi:hypothetical protein
MAKENVQYFDALELVRKVEAKGFKVSKLMVHRHPDGNGTTNFGIEFNPVKPEERAPVEEVIKDMGLEVDGGGTGFDDDKKPTDSDVTFKFRDK